MLIFVFVFVFTFVSLSIAGFRALDVLNRHAEAEAAAKRQAARVRSNAYTGRYYGFAERG